jgi:hypothetical protein
MSKKKASEDGKAFGKSTKSPSESRRFPVGVDPRRDERRLRAVNRQEAYDKLTFAERVARAESRRGESKRELARLRKEKS